jgi:hypothetical protein
MQRSSSSNVFYGPPSHLIEVRSVHRERPLSLRIGLMPLAASNKPCQGHATTPARTPRSRRRGLPHERRSASAGLFTAPGGETPWDQRATMLGKEPLEWRLWPKRRTPTKSVNTIRECAMRGLRWQTGVSSCLSRTCTSLAKECPARRCVFFGLPLQCQRVRAAVRLSVGCL